MSQKKGLIYRITMGKDNLPDFTPNRLPGSRWAVFKDVFFNRLGAMVKISLLTLLFMLPALAWIIFMNMVLKVDAAIVPYSGNLGIGYPVVTDAAFLGQYRTFMFSMQTYLVLIPLIMLAGVGFAGAFHVMKLLAWGEGIAVAGTFFKGIKKNWANYLWIFLFAGVSFFVFIFSLSAYSYLTGVNTAVKVIAVTLAVLQFVLMLCMLIYLCTQTVTYKLKFTGLVKNSLLFAVALFPQNLFFIVLSFLPIVLIMLIPLQISIFFWMIFMLLGVAYIVLIWTVFSQWVYDKFVNDKVKGAVKNRGMYVKNPEEERAAEIERIRNRNTTYGSAYVSRRLSSIDDGKSFTPLEANFSRNDLKKLSEEKEQMREEIEREIDSVNAQLEEEQRIFEEEQAADKKRRKKVKNRSQEKSGKKFSEDEIGILPVSDEEYKDDGAGKK
jgi:membrane protein